MARFRSRRSFRGRFNRSARRRGRGSRRRSKRLNTYGVARGGIRL